MKKTLERFYRDESLREDVKEFLVEYLGEYTVKRAFAREDVSGVADARAVIDEAFSKLRELYEPAPVGKASSSR